MPVPSGRHDDQGASLRDRGVGKARLPPNRTCGSPAYGSPVGWVFTRSAREPLWPSHAQFFLECPCRPSNLAAASVPRCRRRRMKPSRAANSHFAACPWAPPPAVLPASAASVPNALLDRRAAFVPHTSAVLVRTGSRGSRRRPRSDTVLLFPPVSIRSDTSSALISRSMADRVPLWPRPALALLSISRSTSRSAHPGTPGRNPWLTGRNSRSKIGSITNFTAPCTIRSFTIGIPSGRCLPPGLGISTRRSGWGR